MKQEGYKYFTDTHLTVIGMMIFFIWFIAMLYWVLKATPKKQHDFMAQIPLRNND